MKKTYNVVNVENLLKKVVEAVKNGEEYIENSARRYGSSFYFEMESKEVIPGVEVVEVIEDGVSEEQFEEKLKEGVMSHLEKATKKEIVEYIGDRADVNTSMKKEELLKIARELI